MGFLDIAGPIGGGLLGGALSLMGSREANASNTNMANRQMDYQTAMSNTAHQREVADLRAAGLNPILSANAGASAPSGSMTTSQNTMEGAANSAQQMGLALKSIDKDLQQKSKDIDLTDYQVKTQAALNDKAQSDASVAAMQTNLVYNTQKSKIAAENAANKLQEARDKLDLNLVGADAVLRRTGMATQAVSNAKSMGRGIPIQTQGGPNAARGLQPGQTLINQHGEVIREAPKKRFLNY